MVALKKDISSARGGLAVIETVFGGHGDRQAAPAKDLQQVRFGYDAPDGMRALRSDVNETVVSALGVPPALLSVDANSQAQKESFKRFILSSVTGLARKVSAELSLKLDSEVRS